MPKSLTDPEGEVRELTLDDLKRFRPAPETLSPSLSEKLGLRLPETDPTQERVTLRLSREVVQRFRATGPGWQGRVDAALQEWLESHNPS